MDIEPTLNIEDEGLNELLGKISADMGDTLPLTRTLSGVMKAEVMQNFEEEGRLSWKPLLPSTIAQRRREGTWPGKILNRHGAVGLVGSITTRATPEESIVGTNKPYAAAQNFGARIIRYARSALRLPNRGKDGRLAKGFQKEGHGASTGTYEIDIPARPFMVVSQAGISKLMDKTRAWLAKVSAGEGSLEED